MLHSTQTTIARFRTDRSGAGVILFALALPVLLGLGGGALDYAATNQSRNKLQAAADAAALAIAREMTVTPVTANRVRELAHAHVNANLDGGTASVDASLTENGLAIEVKAIQPLVTPLGLLPLMTGISQLDVRSLARVTAASMQTKLCMLSLDEKLNGGLFMHNGSAITAPECVMHSNSNDRNAIIVQNGSRIAASLVCARGGIANLAGQLQTTVLADCPKLPDPLARKPEPNVLGGCTQSKLEIGVTRALRDVGQIGAKRDTQPVPPAPGTVVTLNPGVYCDGLTIDGNARVTFTPGVYVIRGGPLVVRGNAELTGRGVTIMFAGRKAYFRFLDNAMIQLSAPTAGLTAGMLLWESRTFVQGTNSWQLGGCGRSNRSDDDDDDDGSSNRCNRQRQPGSVPVKKTNEHHINSDRARELTGTIYLPNGLLLIDSRRPVADQSPFTVLVASKVDLYDGPNLVLNSNYAGSPVPVPSGLGAIGATQVRLGGAQTAPPGSPPPPR